MPDPARARAREEIAGRVQGEAAALTDTDLAIATSAFRDAYLARRREIVASQPDALYMAACVHAGRLYLAPLGCEPAAFSTDGLTLADAWTDAGPAPGQIGHQT